MHLWNISRRRNKIDNVAHEFLTHANVFGRLDKLLDILERSPIEKINDYQAISGAPYIFVPVKEQERLKQDSTLETFRRLSGIQNIREVFDAFISAPEHFFYRNKMEYTFSNKRWLYENENLAELEHTNALGFHAPGRFDKVSAINKCWLQDDLGNEIRNFVYHFCIEHNFTFYDLREHTGLMRNLMIRNTRKGDWMVNVIFAKDEPDNRELLLNAISQKFNPHALNYCINEKLNDSTFDQTFISYKGNFEGNSTTHFDFSLFP